MEMRWGDEWFSPASRVNKRCLRCKSEKGKADRELNEIRAGIGNVAKTLMAG